ncbi:S-layer homology domain-containing protein [Clostridium formicaceticum]|uniref:Cellulosome-anchoring protein n=1 Tax=Clostridium formicaceticum TaxID=1497 RepID=A0AAC9RLC1_9CLOT|nr:S-layer homology domain-containing protein [Clostridium formicaceticum]AOY76954.1 hypothetical protein BJL90_14470 [Clostridium formicaceticum]ARE87438.1 Cellulosome-anchoring protein precursor [Clostridium formicaceticum]
MKRNIAAKKLTSFLVVAVMILTSVGMAFANEGINFNDIQGHWAEERIIEWAEMDIVRGYGDTFKPDNNITRAEFMSLMNKTFYEDITGEEVAEADVYLADVDADKWYAPIVKKAVAAGYISGYGEGMMKPENFITREEVATILSKIFELEQNPEAVEVFTDIHTVSDWAKGHVGAIVEARFMTGYKEGEERAFKGNNNITRAEAVVTLDNVFTRIFEDIFEGISEEDFENIFDGIFDGDFENTLKEIFGDDAEDILNSILNGEFDEILNKIFDGNFEEILNEISLEDFEEILATVEEMLPETDVSLE